MSESNIHQEHASPKPSTDELMKMMAAGVKPKQTVSETTVNEYAEMENAEILKSHRIPHDGRLVNRWGPGRQELPFWVVAQDYNTVVFKSRDADNLGIPAIGKNIEVMGYDILTDAHGRPRFEQIPNPAYGEDDSQPEFLDGPPILIREKDGVPLEGPISGMTFRPHKGKDSSRQPHAQLGGDKDALTLIPGRGVPKVKRTSQTSGNEYWAVDWSSMHSFQQELEKPMLNAAIKGDTAMLEFINGDGGLPTAANAPSRQTATPGGFQAPTAGTAAPASAEGAKPVFEDEPTALAEE
jgi:hypothetical protein